jgi:uncharacterized protein (DUF983 family)
VGTAVAGDRHVSDLAEQILAATYGLGIDRIVEVALGANIALDERVIAYGGVIAAYASDADPEPRLPFWPLVFKNVVLRLVGSDNFPAAAGHAAVADITACLEAGRLHPRVAARCPLDQIAEAHERGERGGSAGHVLLDLAAYQLGVAPPRQCPVPLQRASDYETGSGHRFQTRAGMCYASIEYMTDTRSTGAAGTEGIPTRGLPPSGGGRLAVLLGRALRRRGPYCGNPGIFRGWFELRDHCPGCGVSFDREEGYFLGAMAINLIVAEGLTVAVVVLLMVFTDLSLLPLEVIAVSLAVGLPILFYPYSKTLWMVLDLMLDPPERQTERRLRAGEMRR